MTDPTYVHVPAGSNYYTSASDVTLVVDSGVTVTGYFEDQGANTSLIVRGAISVQSYYAYAHYSQTASAVVVAAHGSVTGSSGYAFGSDGAFNISNYGTISGAINAYGGNAILHNYGSFTGSIYSEVYYNSSAASAETLELFTGSTNGAVSAQGGSALLTKSVTLLLDDRPTVAANSDVGANSGVTTGTIHDLTGFQMLNVTSGNWSLGANESFGTSTTVASGATLGVAGYTLTTASLTLATGAVIHDAEGASGGINVSGAVNLAGATLDLGSGSAGAIGSTMTIINDTGTGTVQGTFAGLAEGGSLTVGGHSYSISYHGGTGNDVVLTRTADVVTAPPAVVTYDLSTFTPGQQTGFTAGTGLYIPVSAADLAVTSASGGVTLSFGGQSYTFGDGTLSSASQAYHVSLADGSQLLVGTDAGNDSLLNPAKANNIIYGFGGDDDINVGSGNNYISGGTGNDIVYAYDGNNHIWGNAQNSVQGQVDGNDRIIINGGGSNYVNGNAGDDYIEAGKDGSTGVNRLYGGSGNDTIVIHGAGANTANGNIGNDLINASDATGNNLLRGGQGDDVIRAGHGQDQLMGDVGNDVLVAGTGAGHLTVMTGGAGADTFDFSRGAQGAVTVAGTTYYSGVTDFAHGTDHVGLAFAMGAGDVVTATTSFADVASAQAYAQQALAAHAGTTDVAALQVGTDTYLFYDAAGTSDAIDSIVHLNGVQASTLTTGDFIQIAA